MPPPPPPPPPPPSGPPPLRPGIGAKSSSNNKPVERNALLGEIQKGTRLKKTQTNDRSAPLVGGNNKNSTSSAKKYNTIGVHTHRQPQKQHQQPPGPPALWRRGSQDDCSAILKQREKILEKKNKKSPTPTLNTSPPPPPVQDADFLNNILDASAAIKAKANKRTLGVGNSGTSTSSKGSTQAKSFIPRAPAAAAATKKVPIKVETSKPSFGQQKTLTKINEVKRSPDSSKSSIPIRSNITKVNANINSLNKTSTSIGNMTRAAANLSTSTSKGFSTVSNKKDLGNRKDFGYRKAVTVTSEVKNDYSVSPSIPESYSLSSQTAKYQTTYSNSPELSKYTNIDHSSSHNSSPTYNNNTEEHLYVSSSAANTNINYSPESISNQYSNIKSESRARYGNVQESGGWMSNFKKKVSRLSAYPFSTMSSSKSSFEVCHSSSPSSYYSSSSSTLPTDYTNQQQANLRMVKSVSSPARFSSESGNYGDDDGAAQRLVKLRKVPQRQLLTPTKSYTPPESSPSRTHGWRKNLRRNASNFSRFSATRLNVRQPGTPRHRSAAMSHYRPAAMTNAPPVKFSVTKSNYPSNTRMTSAAAPISPTPIPTPCVRNTEPAYPGVQSYSDPTVVVSPTHNSSVYENYATPPTYQYEPATFSKSNFHQPTMSYPETIELEKTASLPTPKVASFQEVTLKQTKFSEMFYGKKDQSKQQFTPFARYMKASYGNPPSASTYWNWGAKTDNRSSPVKSTLTKNPLSRSQPSAAYFRPFGCSVFRPSFVANAEEDYRQKSASAPSLVQSRIQQYASNVPDYVESSPTNTGNKVTEIRQETVRSLVRDRINTWGNNFKDDGNKPSSGPMNSRGPGSPGGPSPLNKPSGGGIGELFPGGIPKLSKNVLKQRQPGNVSPKMNRTMKNGPTTPGDRTPPPNRNVQNGVMSAKSALANRPKPPPAPPTSAPIGINNNINVTNNNNNNNLNTSQNHTAGGLSVNTARRMPGSHPPPPPPPSRPPALPSNRPTAPKNRPNSMIGRPLPPTPTSSSSSSSSSSSLNRNLPLVPSNKAPQPPERTVSTGGSLPRSRAPNHKPPPPQRPPPGQRPPPPPPARPPTGPAQPLIIHDGPVPPQRSSSNCSIGSLDLEKRGLFHNVHEFPPAEPFTACLKTYPSQNAKNTGNRRAPPPPPPSTGVLIAR